MSTATDMVTALETFLATNVGVGSVTIDGQSVSYNRSQALLELDYWRREVAKENSTKPIVKQINLGGSW